MIRFIKKVMLAWKLIGVIQREKETSYEDRCKEFEEKYSDVYKEYYGETTKRLANES